VHLSVAGPSFGGMFFERERCRRGGFLRRSSARPRVRRTDRGAQGR